MKENSNLSVPSKSALDDEPTAEQDSIELIESEMEVLRRRMRRLESRLEKVSGKSNAVPFTGTAIPSPVTSSTEPQSSIIVTPPSAKQNNGSSKRHRRPIRKSTRSGSKRVEGNSRKRRTRKVKNKLLLGYGLLIGVGVASVFVLMVLNLFNQDIYTPASSPRTEITVDETPDLEELRMSIQDAEE